jgi:phosphoglycolate phosphatase-like HAD superfamily hydrolase
MPKYTGKTEMLADLIRIHGLDAAASAMVGDTHEDYEAARGNGIRFIYVTYGYGSVLETDLRVERFLAIEDLLT